MDLAAFNQNENHELFEFIDKLITRLKRENTLLKESIATHGAEAKRMCARKSDLIAEMSTMGPPTNIMYIMQLSQQNITWSQALKTGMAEVNQKMLVYRKEYNNWIENLKAQLQAQIGFDKFTMMPFHEVEVELQRLIAEKSTMLEESAKIAEAGKLECQTLKENYQQLQEEVQTLTTYENEVRKNIEVLIRKLRDQQRCNVLPYLTQRSLTSNDLEALKVEITALETKIIDTKQHTIT